MSEATSNGRSILPKGWERPLLSEIAQINPALDRCIIDDDLDVNFVPMRAVEPEGGGLLRPEVRPFGKVKKGYTPFLSGDVIMAKITPCMENGKTTVVPPLPDSVCFGSTEFHVVRVEDVVAARWIANFLLQHDTRRSAQRAMTGGVGQMRVPSSFLETLHIPIAPSAEQQRIADMVDELLSDLDSGMTAMEQVRAKLKLYRASILKAAVEGALTAEWRAQDQDTEPASELLKRILIERRRRGEEEQLRRFKYKGKEPPQNWKTKYKEPVAPEIENLFDLPKGWCWTTVDQLIVEPIVNGISVRGSLIPPGIAALRLNAMTGSGFDYSAKRYLPLEESDVDDLWVRAGDFFVSRGNGSKELVGRGTLAQKPPELIIFPDTMMRVRLGTEPLVSWFSAIWASSLIRLQILKAAKTTAGILKISQPDLASIEVPLPPLAEQENIVEAVEAQFSVIDHLEADLEAKLKKARALRQSILRHAFTGKLEPQDPDDEPASELLKRIAAARELRARQVAIAKEATAKEKKARKKPSRVAPKKKRSAA